MTDGWHALRVRTFDDEVRRLAFAVLRRVSGVRNWLPVFPVFRAELAGGEPA